jgi:hypothetical protein
MKMWPYYIEKEIDILKYIERYEDFFFMLSY